MHDVQRDESDWREVVVCRWISRHRDIPEAQEVSAIIRIVGAALEVDGDKHQPKELTGLVKAVV